MPTRFASLARRAATWPPTLASAWSSCGSNLLVQPEIFLAAFACFTARSTEFFMPRPRADSEPVSGADMPMTTVWPLPLLPDPPLLLLPQPATAITLSAAGMAMLATKRLRTTCSLHCSHPNRDVPVRPALDRAGRGQPSAFLVPRHTSWPCRDYRDGFFFNDTATTEN